MRTIRNLALLATATVAFAASAKPGAAMVIYPWCAEYGGRSFGSDELRIRDVQTMPGDDRGQRGLLQTEPLVHAVSAATQRRPTDLAMRLPPRSQ